MFRLCFSWFMYKDSYFVCSKTHIKDRHKAKTLVNIVLFLIHFPPKKYTGLLQSADQLFGSPISLVSQF